MVPVTRRTARKHSSPLKNQCNKNILDEEDDDNDGEEISLNSCYEQLTFSSVDYQGVRVARLNPVLDQIISISWGNL